MCARLRRMPMLDLDLALTTARRAVEAASRASLVHFRRGVRVDLKPDRSPVTVADRESEAAILLEIRRTFPDHAVLGEETGVHAEPPRRAGFVDPLDGTRGFTRGEALWGPLVALEHEGEVVAGAMALPVAGEVYFAARGHGAWLAVGGAAPTALRVSGVASWGDATLQLGEPRVLLAPPSRSRSRGWPRPVPAPAATAIWPASPWSCAAGPRPGSRRACSSGTSRR